MREEETFYSNGWDAGYSGQLCQHPAEDWDEDAIESWYEGYEDGAAQAGRDEQEDIW